VQLTEDSARPARSMPHNESEGAARRVLVQPRGSSLEAGFLGRIVERVRMLLINADNLICQ